MAGEAAFLGFATEAMAATGRVLAPHHRLLIAKLEQVAAGQCNRLMVQMPPGSAKSTYGSVLFPAYFLSREPGLQVIATAHTASLAEYFGRQVRATVEEHGAALGVKLARDLRAASRFSLGNGGEYFAAGVQGPITGRRADLVLIDDPIKSYAEAESPVMRDSLHDWYRAELTTRLKPRGRIVLIMTRWHEDDLAGRLLRSDASWDCLRLPALAELNDPLGRMPGAALWPAWQDEAAIALQRREVGERMFMALYQQSPRRPDVAFFNLAKINVLAAPPVMTRTIRAWDLAATEAAAGRDPDYTVGLKLGTMEGWRMVVLDVIRLRASPGEVEARILKTAQADGPATMVALPQDPGQAGLAQIAMYKKHLGGFQLAATPETGSKTVRATPAATQIDNGHLAILAAPWNENFLSELSAFPDSKKDDQVDALSRAVNTMLTKPDSPARRLDMPFLGR